MTRAEEYVAGLYDDAEAARLLALVMNSGRDLENGLKSTPSYTDIQGRWAESYIEYWADISFD